MKRAENLFSTAIDGREKPCRYVALSHTSVTGTREQRKLSLTIPDKHDSNSYPVFTVVNLLL